jgi:hypothetical protein
VLIRGNEIVGTFDTYADALSEGYKLFKLESFIVKQIEAIGTSALHRPGGGLKGIINRRFRSEI